MKKHTSGEWRVFGERISITGFGIYAPGTGFVGVATEMGEPNPKIEESKANARLFAAASDLLEAVEAFQRYTGAPPIDKYSYDSLWEDAWQKGKRAIAKVNGRTDEI